MVKGNSSVKSFWALFFALLATVAIATAVWSMITYNNDIAHRKATTITDENYYKRQLENDFQQSLYSMSESLKTIDSDIDKILICNDAAMQQELLVKVALNANNVGVCTSALPIQASDNASAIETYSNQLTQYGIALARHLSDGKALSDKDRTSLQKLGNTANVLYEAVHTVMTSDSGMYVTNSLFADGANAVNDAVLSIDCKTFDYGKLIYDGPYSDSVEDKPTVKAPLTVSAEQGVDTVKEFFSYTEDVKKVEHVNTINNHGTLYCYKVTTTDGAIEVMLTTDGYVAEFDYEVKGNNGEDMPKATLTLKDCYDIAQKFAQSMDSRLTAVWAKEGNGNVAYVNVVPQHNGVLIYPEMIKLSVDMTNGKIVGMEAHAYSAHAIDYKTVKTGSYDYKTAVDKLAEGVDVRDVKYALVEKCCKLYTCYQLECHHGEDTYYAYIDSNSGKMIDLFKVVKDATEIVGVM